MTRTRNVLEPALPGGSCGFTADNEPCNTTPCNSTCYVSDWSPWTDCTAVCGGGQWTRQRYILDAGPNGECDIPLTQSGQCNTDDCPNQCTFTAWTPTGVCSLPCGGGVMNQTRSIVFPASNGAVCSPLQSTIPCNTEPCPQNCQLSPWSNWGPCSASCNTGVCVYARVCTCCRIHMYGIPSSLHTGLSNRTRSVTVPAVAPGVCTLSPSDTLEFALCNTAACSTLNSTSTCTFSEWGPWSSCSAACGTGYQTRFVPIHCTRVLHWNPIPSCDDRRQQTPLTASSVVCGTPTEVLLCNTNVCPEDCILSEWSSWSVCLSCTAGNSTHVRCSYFRRDIRRFTLCQRSCSLHPAGLWCRPRSDLVYVRICCLKRCPVASMPAPRTALCRNGLFGAIVVARVDGESSTGLASSLLLLTQAALVMCRFGMRFSACKTLQQQLHKCTVSYHRRSWVSSRVALRRHTLYPSPHLPTRPSNSTFAAKASRLVRSQ